MGSTSLAINGVDAVFPGAKPSTTAWFNKGQSIIIDPGAADQQTDTIAGTGPSGLRLAKPIEHPYLGGTMVSVLPAT